MPGTTLRELITRWRFKTDSKPIQKLRGGLTGLKKVAGRVGGALKTMAKVAVAGFVALGAAAAVGLKAAIDAAADAEESESKFAAVFKKNAQGVAKWSEAMAKAANRSAFELRDQAATFGALFNALKFGGKESANLSTHMVKLTEDLASFNNEAAPDVLIALRSGLLGNVEPVLKYGADVRVAAVNQELLNMGIKGGAKAATEQQKVLARLNIIMRATKDAQGDAVRTSGSYTNQMKGLHAAIKTFKILVGTQLLPVITPLVKRMSNAVGVASEWLKANDKLIEQELPKIFRGIQVALAQIFKDFKPDNFSEMADSIRDIIIGLGFIIRWMIRLGQEQKKAVEVVVDSLAGMAFAVVSFFGKAYAVISGFFLNVVKFVTDGTAMIAGKFNDWLVDVPAAIWKALVGGFQAALTAVAVPGQRDQGQAGQGG